MLSRRLATAILELQWRWLLPHMHSSNVTSFTIQPIRYG
jgi:hypothetical protein